MKLQTTHIEKLEAVCSKLYPSNKCRPDISYAMKYCSRKIENPLNENVVKHFPVFGVNKRRWYKLQWYEV